ncbi:MAG TPA: reverse transcriptase-like protein [Candidatus Saccharimonadales bacterium]|nr:reverse transcriptase-like protein [Candidatus Saccharimonadales bacterium]
MKTLKLDHSLAEMVRRGDKTSTWRIYDDKDIRVNDHIELLDKVKPGDPATWQIVGAARVDMIVEKRLGDVVAADFEGHEEFASRDEMLKTYQKYYGPQATFETPIKMIHFTMDKRTQSVVQNAMPKLIEAKLYADGGSRGNPGPSASGFAILNMDGQVVVKKGVYLGLTTNNQAEYQALKLGLEEARSMGIRQLHVYMDSLLVVNQMVGRFKVKNRDLWPIHDAIKQLVTGFKEISFTHVPRELNKIADGAVNEALNEAERSQRG